MLKIVTLGTERWEFDPEALMLSDLFAIKSATGLDGAAFNRGLSTVDPAAYQGLVWWLRMRAGNAQDIKTIDFPVNDLLVTDAPGVDEPEDPTAAVSEPDETATSDSSPTTAT